MPIAYKAASKTIIRRFGPGVNLADTRPVPDGDDNELVDLVRNYSSNIESIAVPHRQRNRNQVKLEIHDLRRQIRALNDRIRRLKQEIVEDIAIFDAALDRGERLTRDFLKRRISRLKGSMEYPGRDDYTRVEK